MKYQSLVCLDVFFIEIFFICFDCEGLIVGNVSYFFYGDNLIFMNFFLKNYYYRVCYDFNMSVRVFQSYDENFFY